MKPHPFEECTNITRSWIPTGTATIFWGLFTWTTGYTHEEAKHLGVCKWCGDLRDAGNHPSKED